MGINGIGRIGRSIMRVNQERGAFDIVLLNDVNPDVDNIAYTLNYDTLYGRNGSPYSVKNGNLISGSGFSTRVLNEDNILNVPWQDYDVDFVIDCSGVASNVLSAQQLIDRNAVKKVFITHCHPEVDFTMVLGANDDQFNYSVHNIVSTSICDATAIAPVLKLIDENFGIDSGFITTLHPWLNYQNLMDGPSSSWSVPGEIYHHYALGRSAIGNMIPKPTSAIAATLAVLPSLKDDQLGSFSYRTPTAIVGSADMTLNLKGDTNVSEIIQMFQEFEQVQALPILQNSIEPLVSLDFLRSNYSAVIDHRWTEIVRSKTLKVVLWYDNEFGYSTRVVDQVEFVANKGL